MLNYMEDYSVLDDSLVGEVQAKISEAEAILEWLKSYTTYTEYDPYTDTYVETSKRNGTDAEIAAYEGIIKELKRYLNKLKGLAAQDRASYAMISGVAQDIVNFNNAIGSVKPSNFVSNL